MSTKLFISGFTDEATEIQRRNIYSPTASEWHSLTLNPLL